MRFGISIVCCVNQSKKKRKEKKDIVYKQFNN